MSASSRRRIRQREEEGEESFILNTPTRTVQTGRRSFGVVQSSANNNNPNRHQVEFQQPTSYTLNSLDDDDADNPIDGAVFLGEDFEEKDDPQQPLSVPSAAEIERLKRMRAERRTVQPPASFPTTNNGKISLLERVRAEEESGLMAEIITKEEDDDVRARIIDTGVDEEVYEEHRGNRISMGTLVSDAKPWFATDLHSTHLLLGESKHDSAQLDVDMKDDSESEETRRWEADQIRKGTTLGIRHVTREVRQATRDLLRNLEIDRPPETNPSAHLALLESLRLERDRLQTEKLAIQQSIDRTKLELTSISLSDDLTIERDVLLEKQKFFQQLRSLIHEASLLADQSLPALDAAEERVLQILSVNALELPDERVQSMSKDLAEVVNLLQQENRLVTFSKRLVHFMSDFRERYPEIYEQSYMDLSLMEFLEPAIRQWILLEWSTKMPRPMAISSVIDTFISAIDAHGIISPWRILEGLVGTRVVKVVEASLNVLSENDAKEVSALRLDILEMIKADPGASDIPIQSLDLIVEEAFDRALDNASSERIAVLVRNAETAGISMEKLRHRLS